MPLEHDARKPDWLKVRIPGGERYRWLKEQRTGQELATWSY